MSGIDAALAAIIGENDDATTVDQFLDTGLPELNYALASRWDGGIAVGRITEISGPPSAGKTAIATAAMAAAQKAGGFAAFCDHERSFSTVLAPRLGLGVGPKDKWIFKKPRTYEESLSLCVKAALVIREKGLIPDEAPIAWVFDSLASMVPQTALFDAKGKEKSAEDRSMHDNTALARATSASFPAFTQHCEELNIAAMFLNQIRTKIGVMYGDPRTTPGGEAPKFYASQRLMLGAGKITKKPDPTPIGMEVTGNVIKNKVARPYLTATWRFLFQPDGTGKFDRVGSTIRMLDKEGVFEKSGNYIIWKSTKYYADQLAARIEDKGEWEELLALLPKKYEPEVISAVELTDEAA